MAYDQAVAERIREQLKAMRPYTEKRMFGGIAFFVNGNMACGVIGDAVMVRVGPERYEEALAQPHAGPSDMTGRPMRGWVRIAPEGYASDDALSEWISQGVEFAAALPPK
jgi:TfoX/Sxy family transcriptional regulator of competence genes